MATKFVSTDGFDGNSGSQASPYQHISYGIAQCTAGDTLYIIGGTYTGGQNVIDSQTYTIPNGSSTGWGTTYSGAFTIAGYPGHTVTLVPPGASGLRFDTNTKTYVVVRNIRINMVNQTGVGGAYPSGLDVKESSHHCLFEDVEIYGGYGDAIGCGEGSHDVTFRRMIVHDIGYTGSINSGYGFYISNAEDVIVEDSTIYACVGYGIHCYVGGTAIDVNQRHHFRRNTFYGNGTGGGDNFAIVYANGSDGLIYNNVIYGGTNNCGGIRAYTNSKNIGIYNNTIYGNPGYGILAQYYATGPVIRNNLVLGNGINYLDAGGTGSVTENHNQFGGSASSYFTNAGSADFTLIAGSAAIDAGADLSAVFTTDKVGATRVTFDLGAHEYTGATIIGSDTEDNFNRTNGGLGANWTTFINPLAIDSSQVVDTFSNAYNGAFWTPITLSGDQFSQATVTVGTNPYPGVGVRMSSAGGGRGYGAFIDIGTGDTLIQIFTAGAYAADVTSASPIAWAVGDVMKLEASGSTLTLYRNGVSVLSGSDSTYTDGAPGIMTFANGPVGIVQRAVDDWSCGEVVGGGFTVPIAAYHFAQQGMQ